MWDIFNIKMMNKLNLNPASGGEYPPSQPLTSPPHIVRDKERDKKKRESGDCGDTTTHVSLYKFIKIMNSSF